MLVGRFINGILHVGVTFAWRRYVPGLATSPTSMVMVVAAARPGPETMYGIGSVSKMLVTVATMKLVDK